jgi:hypothetical protein
MTPSHQTSPAGSFRLALESGAFTAAMAALDLYLAPMRTGAPTLQEIAEARDLLHSALPAAVARRSELAAELARLANLRSGYHLPAISNTWRVVG